MSRNNINSRKNFLVVSPFLLRRVHMVEPNISELILHQPNLFIVTRLITIESSGPSSNGAWKSKFSYDAR